VAKEGIRPVIAHAMPGDAEFEYVIIGRYGMWTIEPLLEPAGKV